MKRALLPILAAAALATSACGGDDTAATASTAPTGAASGTESESPSEAATTPSGPSTNDQVRTACEEELVAQLPDATFANPGTLRVASSAEGKLYTVTGTVDAGGASQPYTCSVVAGADAIEVTEALVG